MSANHFYRLLQLFPEFFLIKDIEVNNLSAGQNTDLTIFIQSTLFFSVCLTVGLVLNDHHGLGAGSPTCWQV